MRFFVFWGLTVLFLKPETVSATLISYTILPEAEPRYPTTLRNFMSPTSIFARFKRKTLFALALIGQSCSRGTRHFSGNDLHFANFISDLRRKKQALWAPIPEIFKTEQILRCSQIQFRISTLARFQLWICCRKKIYKSNSVSFFCNSG